MATAYIAFVNPQMMASAGMDQGAAFWPPYAALHASLWGSTPTSVSALGMGLNAFFTYTIVGYGLRGWHRCAFIAGILFVILTITRLRSGCSSASPEFAHCDGAGMLVGMIGLRIWTDRRPPGHTALAR